MLLELNGKVSLGNEVYVAMKKISGCDFCDLMDTDFCDLNLDCETNSVILIKEITAGTKTVIDGDSYYVIQDPELDCFSCDLMGKDSCVNVNCIIQNLTYRKAS